MATFIMRWPALDLSVHCESLDKNPQAFAQFQANLPIKAVQGHEMVGGWILRSHAIRFAKQPFARIEMEQETMQNAPEGRVSLLFPQGGSAELLVKYGESVDDRLYVPIAQVVAEDLPKLKQAGKAQWKSTTRTKEIIVVEFAEEGK